MLSVLNRLPISQKSVISPVVFVLAIAAIIVIAINALNKIATEVTRINDDLAPDARIATALSNNMYAMRLQMKNYISTRNPQMIARFDEARSVSDNTFAEAQQNIQHPERVAMLGDIKALKQQYIDLFTDDVVVGIQTKLSLIDDIIDAEGKAAREAMTQITQTAYADNDPEAAFYAAIAQQHLLLGRVYTYRFLDENNQLYADRVLSELTATQQAVSELLLLLENPTRRTLAKQAQQNLTEFVDAFNDVVALTKQINTAVGQLDAFGPEIVAISQQMANSVFASLLEQGDVVASEVTTTQRSVLSTAAAGIVLALAITYFVVTGILKPIRQTNSMLEDIAQGDGVLTKRLSVTSQDEIGQLATNFNVFVEKIQNVIVEIVAATQSLTHASSELSVASEQTRQGVEQQEQAIQGVLQHSQELSVTVDEVHRNADVATDEASTTQQSADVVMAVVTDAVTAINQLVAELNTSNSTFERLQAESEKINHVLTLITNITEQINLLALNAAIEAARAGDAGRGFAVVADEVRKLAQKTQESTGEIESLTTSLLEVTAQASQTMQSSCQMASSTAAQSLQAKTSLEDINSQVSVITQKNSDIKVATQQQSSAVSEVANQVQLISNVADETKESTLRSTQATTQLAQLSKRLDDMVGQFKVA